MEILGKAKATSHVASTKRAFEDMLPSIQTQFMEK